MADDYEALAQALDNAGPLLRRHAPGTEIVIEGIERKWLRFCGAAMNNKQPHQAVVEATKGQCMIFMKWQLDTYSIRKFSTLYSYWRQWKMLYVQCTGHDFNEDHNNEVNKFMETTLRTKYSLDMTTRPKPVMNVDALVIALTHHWARDTSSFPTERQRVQLPLILLTAAYTSSRPGELVDAAKGRRSRNLHIPLWQQAAGGTLDELDPEFSHNGADGELRRCKPLCYEDLELKLLADPDCPERQLLAVDVHLKYHKGCDGKVKPTTFLFHEEDDPILCPLTHILALAFVDDAFAAPSIRCPADLYRLHVRRPVQSIKIGWKQAILTKPVFRHAMRQGGGFTTSSEPLLYSTFNHDIARLGESAGFEDTLGGYCIRRATGNAVDGAATKAVRDQVMRHNPKSDIFQSYVNQRVAFDVQAAFLERPSKKALIRAFAHMSLTCDPRAPTTVDAKMLSTLAPDGKLNDLVSLRERLVSKMRAEHGAVNKAKATKLHENYEHVKSQISSQKARRRRQAKNSQRKAYFRDVGTEEIERQLTNAGQPEPDYVEPAVYHEIPERRYLVQLLCNFSTNLSEEQVTRRRIEAVENMIALCHQSEPQSRKKSVINARRAMGLEQKAFTPNQAQLRSPAMCSSTSWRGAVLSHPLPHTSSGPKTEHQVGHASLLKEIFPMQCHPAQCPLCIGDTTKTLSERTFIYSRPAKMMDHVEKSHLSGIDPKEPVACRHPKCSEPRLLLDDLQHYKSHVNKVHGIVLRV